MRSLVVEDDLTCRVFLKNFLSQYGECNIVENGKDAVEAVAAARRERDPYQLVCMDLHMPVMGGQEAIRAIREAEEAESLMRPVRILVTTSLSDMENITNALLGRCNGYLMKPIDVNRLREDLASLRLI